MPHSPSGIKNTDYRQYQKDNQPNIFHYYYIAKTVSRLYPYILRIFMQSAKILFYLEITMFISKKIRFLHIV